MSETINFTAEPISFRDRRITTIHSDLDLENFILRTILEWAKNEYTCPHSLFTLICKLIEPAWMREKISSCRNWKMHVDMIQNIDSNIRAMLTLRPAVTFYDVQMIVEQLYPNHRSTVGPLKKIPIVKQVILSGYDPREMTLQLRLNDLIVDCAEFLNKQIAFSRRPNPENVVKAQSEEKFLHFLKEKYHKTYISELGVKIINFTALRDAVHVHKIDSYRKDLQSKKLSKLLRMETSAAMRNIQSKLKSTKIFPKDSDVRGEIEKFATLPFHEAIQKFFNPFLDEEERIFAEHKLNKDMLIKEDDPMAAVRGIMDLLSKEEVYGQLFHLSAVIGAVHDTRNGEMTSATDGQNMERNSNIDLGTLTAPQWRQRVFHPLLCDIGDFLQTYLQQVDDLNMNVAKLDHIMTRIVDKCIVIVEVLKDTSHLKIIKNKRNCLAKLSLCCQAIKECYKDRTSLREPETMTRLHLDLLPQTQSLLVSVLSRSKVIQEITSPMELSSEIIHIVCKSVIQEHFREHKGKLSLDTLLVLESQILKTLNLSVWPLKGSFIEYVTANGAIFENMKTHTEAADTEGPCTCVAISPQYLDSIIHRLPKAVSINTFIDEVLPTQYGLLISPTTRSQVEDMWSNRWLNMANLMEDSLPAVVNMQTPLLTSASRPPVATNDSESVMRAISEVAPLEHVCHVTKWKELYCHYWGELSQFVQDNVLTAARFNVRIVETELGRLRAYVIVDEEAIIEAALGLRSPNIGPFKRYSQELLGLLVSLFIKTPLSSPMVSLIAQLTAESISVLDNAADRFSDFVQLALSIVPSEFLVDLFTHLLTPLSCTVFDSNATSHLQKAIVSSPSSTIALLRRALPNDVTLTPLILKPMSATPKKAVHMDMKEKDQGRQDNIEERLSVVAGDNVPRLDDDDHRQIVEEIRRCEFGVGLRCDGDTNMLVNKFNRRMARLVDHFSSDLYANPTHFILELIQNADDNQYAKGTRASLELVWQRDDSQLTLRVSNNECGFTVSDLRSLCDIGASTKSTQRLDKIGRKGIGFKSVFLVSDCPEVHSNGFHVRFSRFSIDEHDNKVPSNALMPTWVPTNRDAYHTDGTTIVLPIVTHLTLSIRDSVTKQLHPSLLLFLRRLKHISISNGDEEQWISLVDEDCTENMKVVETDEGVRHTWFMCSRQVTIADSHMQGISPRGLSRTDISVAVPFTDQESRDMPTFAFLPIRSYGLRFIVNADFTIPASREDINSNCPWNKWLIDQAAEVFVHSIRQFLGSGLEQSGITRFVDSVPLPGEIPGDSPFSILVPKLRASLSQLDWLPDQQGSLYPPSQLIIESNDDPLLSQLLCSRLQMSFLHSSVNGDADDRRLSVLKWLGCQQLSLSHLASLLSSLDDGELSDPCLVKSIIVAVHSGLQRETCTNAVNRVLSLLRSAAMWPLLSLDKRTVSISSSPLPIFLPPAHWTHNGPASDEYQLLRRVVCPSFLARFVSESNKHLNPAVLLLKRLGANELSTVSMIERAILPRIAEPVPSRQWLVQVSQFLADNVSPQHYKDTVCPRLSYATVTYTHEGIFPGVTRHCDMASVHLSLVLQPVNNVVSLLLDRTSYTVVDDAHLRCSLSAEQWTKYFLSAGVSKTFHPAVTEDKRVWYPEMSRLLDLGDRAVNLELLRYLDLNWASLTSAQSSSWVQSLASLAWVPVSTSSKDLFKADCELQLAASMHLPSQVVYVSSNEPNKVLISDSLLVHFPFCPVMFQSELLPRHLGMTAHVTSDHILRFLTTVLVDKSVSLSIDQVQDLYAWMARNLSKDSLQSIFNQLKTQLKGELLLLLPREDDLVLQVPAGQCYWSLPFEHVYLQSQQVSEDLNRLLGDRRTGARQIPLVRLFPALRELFVDIVGVHQFPFVESIADTLEATLQLLTPDRMHDLNVAEMELIADVYNVAHFLDEHHEHTSRYQLSQIALIPCLSGRYRAANERNLRVFCWKNRANAEFFRTMTESLQSPVADFVAIDCFSRNENRQLTSKWNRRRLTAAQFLAEHFHLPVLEDHIVRHVDNRDKFAQCVLVQSVFAHLEVIFSQWIQRNMSRDTASSALHQLASIVSFQRADDDSVEVTSSLRDQPDLSYFTKMEVFIGPTGGDEFEMLIGGVDVNDVEILGSIFCTLSAWLLDGDSMANLRDRFKTFYKSLLDLIESSDRNQVSIFIRSHNLRINPFSIDYIYNMLAKNRETESPNGLKEAVQTESARADSPSSEESRKRKMVSVETGVMAKQPRMDPRSVAEGVVARVSSPSSPLEQTRHPSRPGTPMLLEQVSLRNVDAMMQSGRLGEQLANDKLSASRRLGDWDILSMTWINEHTETRLPYDFKLRARRTDSGIVETIYLEVKATSQHDKRKFDLSAQEVTAAWSHRSQYHLLLVFHSGTSSDSRVKYAHVPDLLGQLQATNCKLLIDLAAVLD